MKCVRPYTGKMASRLANTANQSLILWFAFLFPRSEEQIGERRERGKKKGKRIQGGKKKKGKGMPVEKKEKGKKRKVCRKEREKMGEK